MFISYQHTFSWWPVSIYCTSFHQCCTSFNPYKCHLGQQEFGQNQHQHVNSLLILADSLYIFTIKLQTLLWLQRGWLLSYLLYLYPGQTLGIDAELKMEDWWRTISSVPVSYAPIPVILTAINTCHLATSWRSTVLQGTDESKGSCKRDKTFWSRSLTERTGQEQMSRHQRWSDHTYNNVPCQKGNGNKERDEGGWRTQYRQLLAAVLTTASPSSEEVWEKPPGVKVHITSAAEGGKSM